MSAPEGTCPTCERFDVKLIFSHRPGHPALPKLGNHARPAGGRCPGSFTSPAPERPPVQPWQTCGACRLGTEAVAHTCGR